MREGCGPIDFFYLPIEIGRFLGAKRRRAFFNILIFKIRSKWWGLSASTFLKILLG